MPGPSHSGEADGVWRDRPGVKELRRVTLAGLGVNLALAAVKMTAGVLGHSRAMVAGALHTLSDIASDVAILMGSLLWNRPPDAGHPYGHRRIETVVAIGMGLGLSVTALIMGWRAIGELQSGISAPAPGGIAVWAAILSIVAKETLFRWTLRVGRRLRSLALQANAWHHRSDAFSSLPVLLAIAGARLVPDWWFLDRFGALLVALLVLDSGVRILRRAVDEVVEHGAPESVRREIERLARDVPGVCDVHGLRTRYVGGRLFVDVHVLVDPGASVREGHAVATEVSRRMVQDSPGAVMDAVVHIEPDEPSMEPI